MLDDHGQVFGFVSWPKWGKKIESERKSKKKKKKQNLNELQELETDLPASEPLLEVDGYFPELQEPSADEDGAYPALQEPNRVFWIVQIRLGLRTRRLMAEV